MEEGESMGLIPLVFFQKTVSRVVGGRNSISKRLDSLLSISGKVSELLEEEALLSSLQCCNQNLVLRFSRISNKNASLSSCQSWEEKQGSRREKKKLHQIPKFWVIEKKDNIKGGSLGNSAKSFGQSDFWRQNQHFFERASSSLPN